MPSRRRVRFLLLLTYGNRGDEILEAMRRALGPALYRLTEEDLLAEAEFFDRARSAS